MTAVCKPNENGISVRDYEDWSEWDWGGVDQKMGIHCAEIIVGVIKEQSMATISLADDGFPEVEVGLFEFELSLTFRLLPLVKDWLDMKTGRDGVLHPDGDKELKGIGQFAAELAEAARVVRKALATVNPPVAELALD